jgi:MraZ protein
VSFAIRVYGESDHQIDDKGRINIPRKFQPLFEHSGFLTRAFNGKSLIFYSDEAWSEIQQFLDTLGFSEQSGVDIARFLSCGTEVSLDGQGRLSIPPTLRRRANLEKDITLIAFGNQMEIWDSQTWMKFDEEHLTPEAMGSALENINAQRRAKPGASQLGA